MRPQNVDFLTLCNSPIGAIQQQNGLQATMNERKNWHLPLTCYNVHFGAGMKACVENSIRSLGSTQRPGRAVSRSNTCLKPRSPQSRLYSACLYWPVAIKAVRKNLSWSSQSPSQSWLSRSRQSTTNSAPSGVARRARPEMVSPVRMSAFAPFRILNGGVSC